MKNEVLDFETKNVSELPELKEEPETKGFWKGVMEKCIHAKRFLAAAITMGCTWLLNAKHVFAEGEEDPFSFMSGDDNGMFDGLKTTVKQSGRSFTGLMVALGAVFLMVILMGLGLCFMASKNANKRDENKTWLLYVIGGALMVFGASSLGAIIYNMATSI